MRSTATKILIFASGVAAWTLTAPSAAAQGGHTHTAPHGGTILEAAGHHVEFKADSSGAIQVWLLDANQVTLAPPASASVTLMDGIGAQETLPLQVDKTSQRLFARFDRKFTKFQAVVSLSIDGKRHNLRFQYPAHH